MTDVQFENCQLATFLCCILVALGLKLFLQWMLRDDELGSAQLRTSILADYREDRERFLRRRS